MGLSSGYGERLLSSVLPNLRSGFQSEMYLTTRSIHSLRGMLVERLSISKETLNFPHIVTMHGKFLGSVHLRLGGFPVACSQNPTNMALSVHAPSELSTK